MHRTLAALVLAVSVAPSLSFAAFSDVPASHPNAHAIQVLEQLDVVDGYPDGHFGPGEQVTRAEYLKMLYRALDRSPEGLFDDVEAATPFNDVPAGSWYESYVRSAHGRGFISGFPDGTFRPNASVTLFQATKMLMGLEFEPLGIVDSKFPQGDPDLAGQNARAFLDQYKLATGELHAPMARGAVAEMFYRWIVVKKTGAPSYDTSRDKDLVVLPFAIPASQKASFEALREALAVLEANYLRSGDVRDAEVIEATIKGLLEGMGDPHSQYYTGEETRQFFEGLDRSSVGIGAFIAPDDDVLVVIEVVPGSPAEEAGLEPGDEIVRIDQLTVKDDPIAAFFYLYGLSEPGQEVHLVVDKISGGTENITVTLDVVEYASVEVTDLGDGLVHIHIWQFSATTGDELEELLLPYDGEIRGILLDVRDNPGGYLSSTWQIGQQFLPAGATLAITQNDRIESIPTVKEAGRFADTPVVILMNGGSASASEVLAAALSEYNGSLLVGETTYGKGTVQSLQGIGKDGLLRFTIARWLTPSGKSIDGIGLTPNTEVYWGENGEDLQFETGLELLEKAVDAAQ